MAFPPRTPALCSSAEAGAGGEGDGEDEEDEGNEEANRVTALMLLLFLSPRRRFRVGRGMTCSLLLGLLARISSSNIRMREETCGLNSSRRSEHPLAFCPREWTAAYFRFFILSQTCSDRLLRTLRMPPVLLKRRPLATHGRGCGCCRLVNTWTSDWALMLHQPTFSKDYLVFLPHFFDWRRSSWRLAVQIVLFTYLIPFFPGL